MDDFSDSDLPVIEFDDDEIARIKANLGLNDVIQSEEPIEFTPPNRGRKRKRLLEVAEEEAEQVPFEPAKLTKRDEREVNDRLASILTGSTGILALAKPYLQMTDEEAKAISEPLSSYLVRNADTIPIARQVLENYDLLAITLGVMAYVVRVYHDRTEEVAQNRQSKPTLVKGLGQSPTPIEERPEVRTGSFVSAANGEGNGF